ncbi:ABC transporter permease [Cryptosporangium phraense]|uniref:Transport permease protein n=1 Tax=Cryptosporangium phraense TaxID=2593070 RepID=A0A545AV51_9ACTN|nr:ABC transporter permease [Cryptosporangium phraense]TQS45206.1 ABC transporter permease [Cryptosporangium phraense]
MTAPLTTLFKTETRLFLREPATLIWGFLLPVIAFVILAVVPGTSRPNHDLGGLSYAQVYLGIIALISLAMVSSMSLPQSLGIYRERGILRRLSVTPMRPWRLLATQIGIHLAITLATVVVLLLVATLTFDGGFPGSVPGWIVSLVLSSAAMLGLASLISALAPSAKIANAIATGLFFPLMFFAGLWLPQQVMPHWLATLSHYTPLGAASQALSSSIDGHFPPTLSLVVLAAYAVVFIGAAVRRFRWS